MSKRPEMNEDSDDAPLIKRPRRHEQPAVSGKFWDYLEQFLPPGASPPPRVGICHVWSSQITRGLPGSWKLHLGAGRPTEKTLLILLAYLCGAVQDTPCDLCSTNEQYGHINEHGRVWKNFPFPFCVVDQSQAGAINSIFKDVVDANEVAQGKVCCNKLCQAYPAATRRAALRRPAAARSPQKKNSANNQPEELPVVSDLEEELFERQLSQLPELKTKKKSARHRIADESEGYSSDDEKPLASLRTPIGFTTKTPTKSAKRVDKQGGTELNLAGGSTSTTPNLFSMFLDSGRASSGTPRRQSRTARSQPAVASQAPSVQQPMPMPNMAEWEIAPGHITTPGVNPLQSTSDMAFSGPYLNNRNDIPIWEGTSFRVVHLTPGLDFKLDADPYNRRICAVAHGVLHVKMHGTEFQIGVNGIWKVDANVVCLILNRQYSAAVLHITTFEAQTMTY